MEAGALHTEGAGGGGDVPTGFVEGAGDVIAFGGAAGLFDRVGCVGVAAEAEFNGSGVLIEDLAGAEDGHPLDDVAEFAGVAGPGVAFEEGEDGIVEVFGADVVAGAELF
jgi:hypothetical protein